MPFPTQFTPTVGADAYIQDPDPAFTAQYRCRIMQTQPLAICLYPDADNTPADFAQLPPQYHLGEPTIKAEDLTAMPALTVPVRGYAAALQQQGADPGNWQSTTAAIPTGDTPSPMAGIEDAKVPGAKTEGQVEPPTNQNLTPPPGNDAAFDPQPGQMVEVIPSDHSYWGPLAGKQGKVMERNGDLMTVEMDGLPYGNVDVDRFQAAQTVADPVAANLRWVGKAVHIKDATIDSSFRGLCEAMTKDGIKLRGIKSPIAWNRVGDICAMDQEPTPGDEKDKARVDKMKADEAATAEDVINDIQALIEKRTDQETFGKREYRPLMDRWNLLKKKLGDASPFTQTKVPEIDAILTNEKVAKRETLGKREYRPLVEKWKELLASLDGKTTPETDAAPGTDAEPVQQTLPGTEQPSAAPLNGDDLLAAEKAGYERGYKQALDDVKDNIDQMA